MARSIGRLLKGQKAEPAEIADAVAQLARLGETQPDLREPAALQAALLRAIYAEPAPVRPVELSPGDAAASLAGGVPLLRNVPLPFAERDLHAVFSRLCDAFGRAGGALQPGAREQHTRDIRTLQAVRPPELWAWAMALLSGEGAELPGRLEERGLPVGPLLTLIRLSLLPFLEQVAARLAPLREGAAWGRGYCPTCGAWPVLAEQRGLEQFRFLRCGLCASSWQVDRVLCPFCDNRSYLALGYVQVEGEEQKQRAATCSSCQSYLKIRSSLTPLSTPQLLIEELALLHLDVIAMEKGYVPPG